MGANAGERRNIMALPEASAPAASKCAIEDVQANPADFLHAFCPFGTNIGRMIMGGGADLFQPNPAFCCLTGNILGNFPEFRISYLVLYTVTGKRKLAAIAPFLVLIDYTANAVWVGRILDPIENHLGYGRLPTDRFTAGLEIDTGGQAMLFLVAEYCQRQWLGSPQMIAFAQFGDQIDRPFRFQNRSKG